MESEFKEGLSKHDHKSCIKMLITYVHSLPDGTESGDFLALDLGGSNFRVLLISIKDGKDTQIVKKSVLSKELITQTQEVLFDHIASEVATFIKEQNIKETLPLGFTFSFPVEQSSLIAGTYEENVMHVYVCAHTHTHTHVCTPTTHTHTHT